MALYTNCYSSSSSSSSATFSTFMWGRYVSSLKSQVVLLYSKQPIIGLTQEFCWVRACIRSGVAFEVIKVSGWS